MEINKKNNKIIINLTKKDYDEKVSGFLEKKYSENIVTQRGKYAFIASNENSQVNVVPYPFETPNNPETVMLVIPEGKGKLKKELERLL